MIIEKYHVIGALKRPVTYVYIHDYKILLRVQLNLIWHWWMDFELEVTKAPVSHRFLREKRSMAATDHCARGDANICFFSFYEKVFTIILLFLYKIFLQIFLKVPFKVCLWKTFLLAKHLPKVFSRFLCKSFLQKHFYSFFIFFLEKLLQKVFLIKRQKITTNRKKAGREIDLWSPLQRSPAIMHPN